MENFKTKNEQFPVVNSVQSKIIPIRRNTSDLYEREFTVIGK